MTDLSSPVKSSFSETQLLALAGGSSKELLKYTEQSGSIPEGSALDLFRHGRITLPQVVGLLGLSGQGVVISVTTEQPKRTLRISVPQESSPTSHTQ